MSKLKINTHARNNWVARVGQADIYARAEKPLGPRFWIARLIRRWLRL